MRINFRHLFTVSIQHDYYTSSCRDFGFVNVGGTNELARRGRLLVREMDGVLHVLYEADENGDAISPLTGETLFIGLRQLNPSFGNFTAPVIADASQTPLFANGGAPTSFDAPQSLRCVSGSFAPLPQLATRPVALHLKNANGDVLATQQHADAGAAAAFDLRALPSGIYALLEDYGAGVTRSQTLFVDADSSARNVWGMLAIRIDVSFYAQAPGAQPLDIPLHFAARTETLKYYVVAPGFDIATLNVDDQGLNGPGSTALGFAKGAADLSASLLGADPANTVMFSSLSPVARSEFGLRKLHLMRTADVLIEHLPQPSADRSQAQLIIHLTKP